MKKLIEIIIGIAILTIIVSIIFSGVRIITLPKVETDTNVILPDNDVYYNTVANINNGGHICAYNESILISTKSEVLIVSANNQEKEVLIKGFYKSLNVAGDKVYFLDEKNNIYVYDISLNKKKKIKENSRYTKISVVDNMIYGYERIETLASKNKYGGINLENSKKFLINGTEYATSGIYYNGNIIYLKEGKEDRVFILYNIENDKKTELFMVDNFGFSWVIANEKVYYSYSNYNYYYDVGANKYSSSIDSIGIWEYDLDTNSNIKLLDNDKSISIKNISGNKLIYCDGPENNYSSWYMLDLASGKTEKFNCEGSCNEIYVVNEIIIIKSTKEGIQKYRFYDTDGNYMDYEIYY